jgi:hypothetical protein
MPKLSSFIIGIIVFIVFVTAGMGVFLQEMNVHYGIENYNKEDIDFYNKLDDMSQTSEKIKDSTMNISSKSGVLDVLGGFFEASYNTIKIGAESFTVFNDLGERSFNDSNIADPTGVLKSGAIMIIIIALFLGIIIAAIVKRSM